jgi:O-acetyl-ADP-ribose deacetylase (regulator of RNase III)
MELIFFDKDSNIIKEYEEILGPKYTYICTDVNNISNMDYIVSPANSHGLMDGGIDLVYCKMFPGIQTVVRQAIKFHYPTTKLLPVGEVLCVPIETMRRCKVPTISHMIICPTMVTPMDIRGTDNVYLSFKGLLKFLRGLPKSKSKLKISIPAFGTLTGKMSGEDSALQVLKALGELKE